MKLFAFRFSYAFFCLSFSFMCSWVCSHSVAYDVLTLKTLGAHAPELPTARTSGACGQTWREMVTINKQVHCIRDFQKALTKSCFEKRVQLWPLLCPVAQLTGGKGAKRHFWQDKCKNRASSQLILWYLVWFQFSPVATGGLRGLHPKQSSKPPKLKHETL